MAPEALLPGSGAIELSPSASLIVELARARLGRAGTRAARAIPKTRQSGAVRIWFVSDAPAPAQAGLERTFRECRRKATLRLPVRSSPLRRGAPHADYVFRASRVLLLQESLECLARSVYAHFQRTHRRLKQLRHFSLGGLEVSKLGHARGGDEPDIVGRIVVAERDGKVVYVCENERALCIGL